MKNIYSDFMNSWLAREGQNSSESLLSWIESRNKNLEVNIQKISLADCEPWFYDNGSGAIKNKNGSFFSICGIQQYRNDLLVNEQPIIIQNEIGFLGIICRKIEGIYHFLMQAKIEPGNINKVQISPTIQATKSNFTQRHGGRKPDFLDCFIQAKPDKIIVDQIQSEQSSRFFKKRNRNVILETDESIEESDTHRWMTLGQIKAFMRYDNLVNMDTRTVISCIPFVLMDARKEETTKNRKISGDKPMLLSLTGTPDRRVLTDIFHAFNDYKMLGESATKLVDLYSIKNWNMRNDIFACDLPYAFRVIFCDISIQGREVKQWKQPMFEAIGVATFGLACCTDDGIKKFLVRTKPEIGCFDAVELGPCIQREAVCDEPEDEVSELFFRKLSLKTGVVTDVMLSEEGGRFYHEQNRNVIIEIDKNELPELPKGYFWSDYKTLNMLVQVNNCLNIQLRNLLSLLEV